MSAYVVDDCVIDYVLTFARLERGSSFYLNRTQSYLHIETEEGINRAGQILLDQNYRSYNHRYREEGDAPRYRFREHRAAIMGGSTNARAVQAIKACQNIDYQSCETDDWQQTDAYAILQQIKDRATYKLAGWDAAEWGAPAHPAGQPELVRLV